MWVIGLHAVFAAGRAAKPSARAFADFLAAELAKPRSPDVLDHLLLCVRAGKDGCYEWHMSAEAVSKLKITGF
jgi:hypothetical protein